MQKIIEKTYNFVHDFHVNDNSGHDFAHIKRVYANAMEILASESNADDFVVKMAVLLHDVDDYKLGGDGNNVKRFLATFDIDGDVINKILATIDAIGFSKSGANPSFETLEMKILSDADKLDAMGAIGICRTIMYGVSKNKQLFVDDIFPIKNITQEQYKSKRKEDTSINHFFDKLLKLKNAMQTDTGKSMAHQRHEFMIDFLHQFFNEQGLDNWNKYLDEYLEHN